MTTLACLYYEPSGALSALPLIDAADCPGLVVAQASQAPIVQPSLVLMLVLVGAVLALALVRRHCEGLRHG